MEVMIRATKSENRLRGSRIQKKQCGLKLLQKNKETKRIIGIIRKGRIGTT